MNNKGFTDYLNGQKSDADFAKAVAPRWATIPIGPSGLSYYGGKAAISFQDWSDALKKAKQGYDAANAGTVEDNP